MRCRATGRKSWPRSAPERPAKRCRGSHLRMPQTCTVSRLGNPRKQRGEDRAVVIARTVLRPTVPAAVTLKEYGQFYGDLDLSELIDSLTATATLKAGESHAHGPGPHSGRDLQQPGVAGKQRRVQGPPRPLPEARPAGTVAVPGDLRVSRTRRSWASSGRLTSPTAVNR
jgi:hypothetical protein